MSGETEHYKFKTLGSGDHFSEDSYRFTDADRHLMDRLLFLATEGHHHTGGATDLPTVEDAPILVVDTGSGSMEAGRRYFYKYTLVDANGFESAASPESFMDTPPAVLSPAAPTAELAATGGSLPPGNFYYVLSAYTGVNNLETVAGPAVYVAVPYANGMTNKITLTMPVLPGGADGFNIYRRTPSGSAYFHIGTTTASTFVDDGTPQEDCDRRAPEVSTAQARNSITVRFPGVDPEIPAGYAWRIYRSTRSGDYANSLLTTITDGSVEYIDTGVTIASGQPPTVGISPGAPTQIDLTDAREVQGRLPLAAISAFPHSETFAMPGPVVTVQGTTTWVCPFPQATIMGVQVALGRGSVASDDLYATVNVYRNNTWTSIFPNNGRPFVPTGEAVGASVVPGTIRELVLGDRLTVDIPQDGDPATDQDMTVVIYMYVYGWTALTSHVWDT